MKNFATILILIISSLFSGENRSIRSTTYPSPLKNIENISISRENNNNNNNNNKLLLLLLLKNISDENLKLKTENCKLKRDNLQLKRINEIYLKIIEKCKESDPKNLSLKINELSKIINSLKLKIENDKNYINILNETIRKKNLEINTLTNSKEDDTKYIDLLSEKISGLNKELNILREKIKLTSNPVIK